MSGRPGHHRTLSGQRLDQCRRYVADFGTPYDGEALYRAANAAWSYCNPQTVSWDYALGLAVSVLNRAWKAPS